MADEEYGCAGARRPGPKSTSVARGTGLDDMRTFLFRTKDGTSLSVFEDYIRILDGGRGLKVVFDGLDNQAYSTELTIRQALEVKRHPIISWIGFDEMPDHDN